MQQNNYISDSKCGNFYDYSEKLLVFRKYFLIVGLLIHHKVWFETSVEIGLLIYHKVWFETSVEIGLLIYHKVWFETSVEIGLLIYHKVWFETSVDRNWSPNISQGLI